MTKLIHKELNYKIRGILFNIFNRLGPNLPEKVYCDAAAIDFKEVGIRFQTEKQFSVQYRGVEVGRYFVTCG